MGASMHNSTIKENKTSKIEEKRKRSSNRHTKLKMINSKPQSIPKEVENYVNLHVNSSNYNYVRRIINKRWAEHPEAHKYFDQDSINEMRKGKNPFAPIDERLGRRVKMEYDHYREQRVIGTDPCDVSNLRLVSPKIHTKKIGFKFNTMSGAWIEKLK